MKVEEKKSLKLNMVLNMLRGLLGVVFPLITFPYITRILGVDNIGQFNFANSIVSYFVLLAGLGINTYGVRNGSPLREKREQLEIFAKEIFTLNCLAMVASYALLIVVIQCVPKLSNYKLLIIILSSQIVFKTIGVEWIYTIYEEYLYITIRTLGFQFLSLILMFVFVHKSTDIIPYALATVAATSGSNVLNLIHSRKYITLGLTRNIRIKEHIKPIMVMFATAITVTIYVSSDTTILGLICGDYEVGIYAVSVKIYTLLKTVLSSAIVVSIPRMAKYYEENRYAEFARLGNSIYKTFFTFIIPSIVGVICLSNEIVFFIAGDEYRPAWSSLILLSFALFFCLGAGFWSQAVMISQKKENKVLFITIISALINVGLNFIFIPMFKENGAAITTIIAEGIVFVYCRYSSKGTISYVGIPEVLLKTMVGILPMPLIVHITKTCIHNNIVILAIGIISCVLEFVCLEIIIKNEIVIEYWKNIKEKLKI